MHGDPLHHVIRWHVETPSFSPGPVTYAPCERRAPRPSLGMAGAGPSAQMNRSSTRCGPRGGLNAVGLRCAHVRLWNTRSLIHGHTKAGGPATRACGTTRLMAVVMRR